MDLSDIDRLFRDWQNGPGLAFNLQIGNELTNLYRIGIELEYWFRIGIRLAD